MMSETTESPGTRREVFVRTLAASLEELGLELDREQFDRLWGHFQRVVSANQSFNLTRITEPVEAAIKHYADSLSLLTLDAIDRNRSLKLLDVGTGAGYPGVPLAIACPRWQITAIDGTGKKARFVAQVAGELGLKNLRAEQSRGERWARSSPGAFELVCLRAVTSLDKGLNEVHRLVRPGGRIVFYKSAGLSAEERAEGDRMALQLGLSTGQAHEVSILGPTEDLNRVLMVYGKRSGKKSGREG